MEPERERIMTPEEARRDHREMLRYMGIHALYGLATGATVAGVLIWLNIGAVGTHIARSTSPILATHGRRALCAALRRRCCGIVDRTPALSA
ncbi:hypothetical protein [Ensifer sp. YR511]|uniref:hypothetical protein n=1 Tax=Ensifer sp. YR511 TaxID=1855294 RepID=UPI0008802B99|nr:hypothetical protein [Ensifer sp. YR511]SDN43603.1 hypothetical protein SAMN05216328_12693 [Ensifer sp. YR511]